MTSTQGPSAMQFIQANMVHCFDHGRARPGSFRIAPSAHHVAVRVRERALEG